MSVLDVVHPSSLSRIGAVPLPRISATVAAGSMAAVSLAPGLLPRTAVLQGLFSGVLMAVGIFVAWALTTALQKTALRTGPRRVDTRSWRARTTFVSTAVVAMFATSANGWQNSLRVAMGAPPIGVRYWVEVMCIAALTVLILTAVTSGIRKVLHRLGFARSLGIAAICAFGLHLAFGGIATASAQSVEGQKFLAAGTDSVRVYADLDSGPNARSRADQAVAELDHVGGFARSAVVVAVPTGSGWIDTRAVDGIEQRFGSDVAIVGQQYSAAPSWAAFLFQRSDAEESAQTLLTAVATRIAELPAADRPDLYLYGQSLGAVGGSAALTETLPTQLCAVLWAGPPAGATRVEGTTVLANTSDPVVWWSPTLMTTPPDLSHAVQDAPMPQWIPVVSFLQTSVDMLASLDVPAGHGHRYGTEQGTQLGTCH
ncbi:alpha/beta-hydrolase family protein [Rhodococcus sp. NPDC056743]|uniref:alpha/beta-hydrolase family protein n=1 Tax=Rhodococcus sp. NPDC056743 TaxID=3345934 RepID=UPI00366EC9DA